MSDDCKKGWSREDTAKKKAIAAHFSKPAPTMNSEITAYLSDTGYDSEHTAGSEATYVFATGFDADDDAGSDGGIEAKSEDPDITTKAVSSSKRPAGRSIMKEWPNPTKEKPTSAWCSCLYAC